LAAHLKRSFDFANEMQKARRMAGLCSFQVLRLTTTSADQSQP